MSIANFHARTAFEREAGSGVRFVEVRDTDRGTEFVFRLTSRGTVHAIATSPTGKGRQAIEDAAAQAGRWARIMADRAAA